MEKPNVNKELTMQTHDVVDVFVRKELDWPTVEVVTPTPWIEAVCPAGPVRPQARWKQVHSKVEQLAAQLGDERSPAWRDAANEAG